MFEIALEGLDQAWHEFPRPELLEQDQPWPLEGVRVLMANITAREATRLNMKFWRKEKKGKREVNTFDDDAAESYQYELLRRLWKDVEGVEGRIRSGEMVPFKLEFVTEDGVEKVSEKTMKLVPGLLYGQLTQLVTAVVNGVTEAQSADLVFTADSPASDSIAGESKANAPADSPAE